MDRSLFLGKSKHLDITDYYLEPLRPNLPFSGGKGICQIGVVKSVDDDRELCYYKILYDYIGKMDSQIITVPRCKGKNLRLLLDDYYADLKKYLDLNHEKCLEYKAQLREKNLKSNKKIDKIKLIAAVSATAISIPILLSTTYVGAIIGGTSIFSLYKLNEGFLEEKRKRSFVTQYDQIQKDLVGYQSKGTSIKLVRSETNKEKISEKITDSKMQRSYAKTKSLKVAA